MAQAAATSVGRYVPIVRWLPRYQRRWLRADTFAGLAVASVAVPTALGYAGIADVPVQVGLYALPGALLAYAVLGSSRQLSVGPSSTVALMSGSVVFGLAGTSDPARAIALSGGIAIAAGLILILAGALRLGWATDFISRPVITGFTFGLGVTAIAGELPHVLGLPKEPNSFVPRVWSTLGDIGAANPATAVIGIVTLAVLFGGRRWAPRWPWALIVMVVAIGASAVLDPASHGIETLGTVPGGLPPFSAPALSLSDLQPVLVGGLAVAIVGLGEGLSAARIFAASGGYRIQADQEFVATGAANVAAGFSGGLSVCGSLSRTATGVAAGARSQVSALVAMAAVLLVLAFLTGPLAALPRVVLSGVVIVSVWFLLDVATVRRYRRVRRNDFNAALTALVGVLLFGPLYGLLAAVALSLLGLVYRSSRVSIDPLGRIPTERAGWGSQREHPERKGVSGLLVLRLDSPLFWANAADTHDRIMAQVDARPGLRALVLDLEATGQLDTTAVDALQSVLDTLRAQNVDLFLARVHGAPRLVMARSGFEADLGPGRIWHSISQAVTAATRFLGLPDEEPVEWTLLAPSPGADDATGSPDDPERRT